jgi:5-methylcytosine-specific restriction endonuclease McrA
MTGSKWRRNPDGDLELDGWTILRGLASGARRAWWVAAPEDAAPRQVRGPYWSLARAKAAQAALVEAANTPPADRAPAGRQPAAPGTPRPTLARSIRPDAKRSRRVVGRPGWAEPKLQVEGRCRVCQAPGALHAHHLVPRSQGGDDYWINIVPLCQACHAAIHAEHSATRSALRALLTPDETLYVDARQGRAWLDDRYPPS